MKKYAGIIAVVAIAIIIILVLVIGERNRRMNAVANTFPEDIIPEQGIVTGGVKEPVSVTKPTPISEPQKKPETFTLAEIATRNIESNCYSAINGVVYDLTAWINKHPGGSREILRICGKDGSSAFNGQHGGDAKPERILAGFEVGVLN